MAAKRKPASKKKSAGKIETVKPAPRRAYIPAINSAIQEASIPVSAKRFNTGKPQLSYILTFEGAAELMGWPERIQTLAEWYRGLDGYSLVRVLDEAFHEAVEDLGLEAFTVGVARVADVGAKKYARGNYLLGRGWSDTCDSLLRHALAHEETNREFPGASAAKDGDSGLYHAWHEAWNWCFLRHCVATMPDRDDRVRAPKPEDGE